jgi:transposase
LQDTKLFETILGITSPWHIARVELKTDEKRVDLWREHEPTRWPCPECATELAGFDHAEERTWHHLDTCQFQTHLHAEIPRVQCPTHGVKQVRVPWAEPRSRFTLLMKRLIIDLILQCSTVKAGEIAGVSWDEAWGIMQRAVARGQSRKAARPMAYIGVDEKAFRKGHRYHTIVCDLERSTVDFVAEERNTESLAAYYAQLTAEQKSALQAVAMDMWEPYIGTTREPDGETKIVFDRECAAAHSSSYTMRQWGAQWVMLLVNACHMSTQAASIRWRWPHRSSVRKNSSSVACVRSRPNHTACRQITHHRQKVYPLPQPNLVNAHLLQRRPTPVGRPPGQIAEVNRPDRTRRQPVLPTNLSRRRRLARQPTASSKRLLKGALLGNWGTRSTFTPQSGHRTR